MTESVASPAGTQGGSVSTGPPLSRRVSGVSRGQPAAADERSRATIHVSAGAPHAFAVSSETARLLVLTTPNHEAFFRAASEPAPERVLPPEAPPDMARVEEAAARFGVEILGPPPCGA